MTGRENEIRLDGGNAADAKSIAGGGSRPVGLRQAVEICILLAIATVAIVLIFFKFTPDAGFIYFYNMASGVKLESDLVSVDQFKRHYLSPDSVNYPRFLGNMIVYELSKLIGSIVKSTDPRLSPFPIISGSRGLRVPLYRHAGASHEQAPVGLADLLLPVRVRDPDRPVCLLSGRHDESGVSEFEPVLHSSRKIHLGGCLHGRNGPVSRKRLSRRLFHADLVDL
jgi:hypothetical protein